MSLNEEMTALANAIRSKTGGTSTLGIAEMTTEVSSIETANPFSGFEMLSSFAYANGAPDNKFVANLPYVTSLASSFSGCAELLDVELNTTTYLRNLSNFAYNAKIKTVKFSGTTERVTTFSRFAQNAVNLTTATGLDFSAATNTSLAFSACAALTTVEIVTGTVKVSLSFSDSPLLSDASIQSIVDGLADLTGSTAQTLTLHADVKAKLTSAQSAAITAKNWTLA